MENITTGMLSTLVIEAIKKIIRLIKKDSTFDFSEAFYVIVIPLVNLLMQFVLVWLGLMPTGELTISWQLLFSTLVSSLISLLGYNQGLKPLKVYARNRKAK